MITSYFTLKALAAAWNADLPGLYVGAAFSQMRDELALGVRHRGRAWTLRFSADPALPYVFRAPGLSRARRNVAALFDAASNRPVTAVRVADRDRVFCLELEGGLVLQAHLFGPRPNVFLTDPEGVVLQAFQRDDEWRGRPAPAPRPAPEAGSFDAFRARWRADRKSTAQAVSAALPLFDRLLAAETIHRAGVSEPDPARCSPADLRALFDAAAGLLDALERPEPRLYWQGRRLDALSLVELRHLGGRRCERFERVDDAVRTAVRRRLAQQRFDRAYRPLERALEAAHRRLGEQSAGMLESLLQESRADRYERWGHLLMAAPGSPPGASEALLPDLFGGAEPVRVPLDPARSAVENAARYYEKARHTRQARAHAEERLDALEARRVESERLLARVRGAESLEALDRIRAEEAEPLARLLGEEAGGEQALPFRRFRLEGGFEAWVGKNARQNDELTFRHARKHDLWLHARGVPGAHVVLRRPHRDARPGRPVLEAAAGIAAYYSEARGSELVPVQLAERKFVRRLKGADPGAVRVDREEVLLVEPRLPG